MKMQNFSLIPYGHVQKSRDLQVKGSLRRHNNLISIWFHLVGVELIYLPEKLACSQQRTEELWKTTCFELFFTRSQAPHQASQYWEVNLAPTGEWDVYRFEGYRQGMLREEGIDQLSSKVMLHDGCLTLHCTISLNNIEIAKDPLSVGVSSVLHHKATNQCSYWALSHGEERADFHNPDTFILTL